MVAAASCHDHNRANGFNNFSFVMVLAVNIENSRLQEICHRHGVSRLELFGSAVREDFDPDSSDLDFLVEFAPSTGQRAFERYFGLREELAALFGRSVDLVIPGAVRNPYVRTEIDRDRTLLYAA